MHINIDIVSAQRPSADVLVVPMYQVNDSIQLACEVSDLKDHIQRVIESKDFSAKQGSTLLMHVSKHSEIRVLLLGLGELQSVNKESLRKAYSAVIKRCRGKKWEQMNVMVPVGLTCHIDDVVRGITEGITLSNYVFEHWINEDHRNPIYLKKTTLIGASEGHTALVKRIMEISTGVNFARDLVNGNASDITPQALAQEALNLSKNFDAVKTRVLDKKALQDEKLELILAVGSGSSVDPTLIIVEYQGAPASKDVTMVVGKGVTFDTGGLNLKPTNFIEDMRVDMGGAAAALGLIQAAAASKMKANIVAIVPSTENAIGPKSYKPGDVYRAYSGKTVEITNTDAEGRLILADALSYGQKYFKPSRIVDLATLTGAILIALGDYRTGMFSNHDGFARSCEKAGEDTGELVWRMPLDPEYRTLLKSTVADVKNASTKRLAGSVTAAMFLQEFIADKKTPWIHLDIAGTAFLDAAKDYHFSQATGVGVRLLIQLIEDVSSK